MSMAYVVSAVLVKRLMLPPRITVAAEAYPSIW
jgi:hypothetical protein